MSVGLYEIMAGASLLCAAGLSAYFGIKARNEPLKTSANKKAGWRNDEISGNPPLVRTPCE